MSDADATDPVKALREWCAIPERTRVDVASWMGEGPYMEEPGIALRLLSAAPALLARIEAGEGLLRRGVGPMPFHYDRAIWIKAVDEHLAEIDASDETEAPRG